MNAVLSQTTLNPQAALKAAHSDLQLRKAQREQAQQELQRHRATRATQQDRLERAIAAETDTAVDIDAAPALAQQRRDVEAAQAAAERLVSGATTKLDSREIEVRAAHTAVERAVDAILMAEAEGIAARIKDHIAQAKRLGDELRAYLPDPLHTAINALRAPPPNIQAALDLLPPRDLLRTPISEQLFRPAACTQVAARRAALIAGDADAATVNAIA